jgi:hypothetical protein
MDYDSLTGEFKLQKPADVNSANELKTEMTAYFNRKEGESVASIPEFRDLLDSKSDASFWVNSASQMEDLPIPLPKVKELLQNSYTAATLDFEDGKVVVNSKSYTSKALSDLMEKYKGPTADLSLVEKYPSNNINGFLVFAFNPEFFNGIVNQLEVGGMVDAQLSKMMGSTYTLKEALKAIKGDFAVVVSDFGMTSATAGANANMNNPATLNMPSAKVLFNAPVGDKAQLNKLLDKLVEQQMMVKENGQYRLSPAMSAMGMQASIDDKNVLIATDSTLLSQYKASTAKATINSDVLNAFKGKSSVGYLDIEKTLTAIPASAASAEVMTAAKETFRDIRGYADQYNGKYTEGHFELRLKNDKENSLTSLVKFLAVAGEAAKKSDSRMMPDSNDVMVDTATAPITTPND